MCVCRLVASVLRIRSPVTFQYLSRALLRQLGALLDPKSSQSVSSSPTLTFKALGGSRKEVFRSAALEVSKIEYESCHRHEPRNQSQNFRLNHRFRTATASLPSR